GLGEDLREALRDVSLRRPGRGTGDLGLPRELALDRLGDRAPRGAGGLEQVRRETVGLLEERLQDMLDVDALVPAASGETPRLLERFLHLMGDAVPRDHRRRNVRTRGRRVNYPRRAMRGELLVRRADE